MINIIYLGIDAFLISGIIGVLIWIIGYKTGRLREMYASLTEPIDELVKWYHSWKYYKQPRVITLKVPGVKPRTDEWQNPLPEYLRRGERGTQEKTGE